MTGFVCLHRKNILFFGRKRNNAKYNRRYRDSDVQGPEWPCMSDEQGPEWPCMVEELESSRSREHDGSRQERCNFLVARWSYNVRRLQHVSAE